VLAVQQLEVRFPSFDRSDGGERCILQDVSFELAAGESLGLVGESGCGKSMTALSIMGLIPPPGYISQGSIRLKGRELVGLRESELRQVRGKEMAMIFQDPTASLNPSLTIGQQIMEPLQQHHHMSRQQAHTRALELLSLVHVPEPHHRIDDYPHQFSGGMAQRVMIARALACNQQLLLADEPTTALDVTVQGQILDLFADLRQQLQLSLLLITHNLGVVAEVCDRVVVMYAGQVCEIAPVQTLFAQPAHPYTAALIHTIPDDAEVGKRLPVLPGIVPDASAFPTGCRFQSRCPFATKHCLQEHLPLRQLDNGHASRCVRIEEIDLTDATQFYETRQSHDLQR
jgi:oligopeptide/dipeptide ABC transporter ATP-binding protein